MTKTLSINFVRRFDLKSDSYPKVISSNICFDDELFLEHNYYEMKPKITPICIGPKRTPISVLFIDLEFTKTLQMTSRTTFQISLPFSSSLHGR